MIDNYFLLGDLIIGQLKSSVPALHNEVHPWYEFDDMESHSTPGCYVMYAGDKIESVAVSGARHTVKQTWHTTLRFSGMRDSNATRVAAGQVVSQVLSALGGWKPDSLIMPLVRAEVHNGVMYEGGMMLVILGWETSFVQ